MRKWLMVLLAALGSVGALVSTEFGLTVQLGSVVAGLGVALVYVFGEARADMARIKEGVTAGKLKDPKFWLAFAGAVIAGLGSAGMNLPVSPEIISAVLAVILGALFKKTVKDITG